MTDRERWANRGAELEETAGDESPERDAVDAPSVEDLSAVQADDALLDALGGSDPKVADGLGDQELNALLLAWRREADSEPLAELVTTDTAVTTIKSAALARRRGGRVRKHRMLVPVAAAAAVLAIAFTGTGLAARDAQPGDTLWGLTKVLYADHAQSVEAASSVRGDLETAKLAIAEGKWAQARQALDAARSSLAGVAAEDDQKRLEQQHLALLAQLNHPEQPPQQPLPPPQQPPDPAGGPVPPPLSSTELPTQPSENPTPTLPTSSTGPSDTTSSTPSSVPSSSPGDGTLPGSSGRYDSSNSTPQLPTP